MLRADPTLLVLRMTAIIFVLTVHEYCHAVAAYRLGDPTAKNLGRVSLNPLRHLDFFGTLMILFGPVGWGKPVPVNPRNLRNPVRDDVIVSFAGAGSSLALGIAFGLLLRGAIALMPPADAGLPHRLMTTVAMLFVMGTLVGLGLGLFNMIPLAPLDGSHVLRGLIPAAWRPGYDRLQRRAPMILLALLIVPWITGRPFVFHYTLWPALGFLFRTLTGLAPP